MDKNLFLAKQPILTYIAVMLQNTIIWRRIVECPDLT